MKIISNGDVYADILSTAAIATIPFIAIGVFGQDATFYVSVALGIIFACGYFARLIFTVVRDTVRKSRKLELFMDIMLLPYVIALTGLIFILERYEVEIVLWMALCAAVLAAVLVRIDYFDFYED